MIRGVLPTRRLVVAATGALLLPAPGRTQLAIRRRIAYLASPSRPTAEPFLEAFRDGLRALGHGDEDITIEIRFAEGHLERLPDLAGELVRLAPEVMVATSTAAVEATKHSTSTIPIVMVVPGDPVVAGFVASLAHPGGNVTGLSIAVSNEIAGKWVQLLHTAIPGTRRIAFLINPANAAAIGPYLDVAQQAAGTLRLELVLVEASGAGEIDAAFAIMTREHADALIVPGDPMFLSEANRIVALAARSKIPAIYGIKEFATEGGLMGYGASLKANFRRAAMYVDKILRGAKPADLPIEQPTKFELVVNLKTAKALGVTIPTVILAGADEMIE